MRLRDFVGEEEERGEVLRVESEVSPIYQAPLILKRNDGGPIVVFEKVKGSELKAVGNVLASRKRLLDSLEVKTFEEAYSVITEAMEKPLKPTIAGRFEEFYKRWNRGVDDLPVFKYYEGDAGRYITSSIVIAELEGICNASVHRLLVLNKSRAAIRIVPRHLHVLYKRAQERNTHLPVAVVIGCHPSVMLAAASSPPFGVNEIWVANSIAKGRVKVAETPHYGIQVPVDAEIVLEGRIRTDELVDEGPFADITGTYDAIRKQPVLEVEAIYVNEDPLFQAVLPASVEHRLLMGFPKEAELWSSLRRVLPGLRAIRLTEGGCGWLHAVIAIDKVTEGDGKTAIMAAFGSHPSLKHVVVVDSDVNVDDPRDVEWAIATRLQADKGLVIVKSARGSSLDPSADPETLLTCKVGLDATKPLKRAERFERARIPEMKAG
ncbi:MAG: UbiD family decarboxylase [Thermoprotei archaeon]|nr:MAG: UbiD family decarboxylase [Thermoprotei archaeon]